MDNLSIAREYANDVIINKIKSCRYLKLAAKRFISDLKNLQYYYNDVEVDTIVLFINQFNLTEDSHDKKFILQPWQTFIICNLYGLYNKETNTKKYNQIYIELARKQGKSQLITILALYHLIFDNDSQVIISANSREQAKNVDFKKVKQFANQIDNEQRFLTQYFNKIICGTNELIVTASDAKRLDGLNASFVLIDEFHEAKSNELYNVLKSSQGSREDAMFFVITTAGFNTDSFCYSLRTYCTDLLNGTKSDEQQFAVIYTLDEGDDYTNKDNWVKANPNINVSLKEGWLSGEVNKSINNSVERNGVLVKNFNIWMKSNSLDVWIEDKYFDQSMSDIKLSDFKGCEVICGVDLSSVSDISAVSYLIQSDDKIYYFNNYYICEDSMSSNINREIYKNAASNGY